MGGGGFGGVSGLEKKRQYKVAGRERRDRYGMVYDEDELRQRGEREGRGGETRERSRSRSPLKERDYEARDERRERGDERYKGGRDRDRDGYEGGGGSRGGRRDDSYQPSR